MDSSNKAYNPADDDNQGVVQLMAQGQEATPGISQNDSIDPVKAQGPESEKAETNDTDVEDANDDVLAEEDVENGEADTFND